MNENEFKILDHIENKTKSKVYFVPLVWAASLVTRSRKEGRIKDDLAVKTLIDVSWLRSNEIANFSSVLLQLIIMWNDELALNDRGAVWSLAYDSQRHQGRSSKEEETYEWNIGVAAVHSVKTCNLYDVRNVDTK